MPVTIPADTDLKLVAVENATERWTPAAERGEPGAHEALKRLMERHSALVGALVPGLG